MFGPDLLHPPPRQADIDWWLPLIRFGPQFRFRDFCNTIIPKADIERRFGTSGLGQGRHSLDVLADRLMMMKAFDLISQM